MRGEELANGRQIEEALVACLDLKAGRGEPRGKAPGIGAEELAFHMVPGGKHEGNDPHAPCSEFADTLHHDGRIGHGELEYIGAPVPHKLGMHCRKRVESACTLRRLRALRPRFPMGDEELHDGVLLRVAFVQRGSECPSIGRAREEGASQHRSLAACSAHTLGQVGHRPSVHQIRGLHGNATGACRAHAPENILESGRELTPALERADHRSARIGDLARKRCHSLLNSAKGHSNRRCGARTGGPVSGEDARADLAWCTHFARGRTVGSSTSGELFASCSLGSKALFGSVPIGRNAPAALPSRTCRGTEQPARLSCAGPPALGHERYRASEISSGTRLTCLSLSTWNALSTGSSRCSSERIRYAALES